jgi:hypothetical protein
MAVLILTTKFSIGQEVFFLDKDKISKATISRIELMVGKDDKIISVKYYANTKSILNFIISMITRNDSVDVYKLPNYLYESSEDLMNNISKNISE